MGQDLAARSTNGVSGIPPPTLLSRNRAQRQRTSTWPACVCALLPPCCWERSKGGEVAHFSSSGSYKGRHARPIRWRQQQVSFVDSLWLGTQGREWEVKGAHYRGGQTPGWRFVYKDESCRCFKGLGIGLPLRLSQDSSLLALTVPWTCELFQPIPTTKLNKMSYVSDVHEDLLPLATRL